MRKKLFSVNLVKATAFVLLAFYMLTVFHYGLQSVMHRLSHAEFIGSNQNQVSDHDHDPVKEHTHAESYHHKAAHHHKAQAAEPAGHSHGFLKLFGFNVHESDDGSDERAAKFQYLETAKHLPNPVSNLHHFSAVAQPISFPAFSDAVLSAFPEIISPPPQL